MERFTGTCEPLVKIDVTKVASWIKTIPFEDWPQQRKFNGELRPAMVTDPEWYGFKAMTDSIVDQLMENFPGCAAEQRMLSVVMPGHFIEPHKDEQSPRWLVRIHVPLTTNKKAMFISSGKPHNLKVGMSYRINTLEEHEIMNNGSTPRVHMMFDVRN